MNTYITIGVTGGIGAGKSIVCRIIATMGYPVFYSDKVAKEILDNDPSVVQQVSSLLGNDAYKNGTADRPYIAKKIFSDESLKEGLNNIIHPAVRRHFESWCQQQDSKLVFNEAAILFETGSYKNFDKLILVTAPKQTRIERVMNRDSVTSEEVEARMNNQWPDEKKIPLADFVVENSDDSMLIPQVIEILESLNS